MLAAGNLSRLYLLGRNSSYHSEKNELLHVGGNDEGKVAMLEIKNLKVKTGKKTIIKGVSFDLPEGQVTVLMGPNGSGKSSLALALAGHPHYQTEGKIILNGKRIDNLSPEERAKEGLFLGWQTPVEIPGLEIVSFLWEAYRQRKKNSKEGIAEFKKRVQKEVEQLGLPAAILQRGLNEKLSGGEKKRLEVLQAMVLEPKYAIFDEPDSGLDVDALRIVAQKINNLANKNGVGCLLITHYQRIFNWLKPQKVMVIEEGEIRHQGGLELVEKIEKEGYQGLVKK